MVWDWNNNLCTMQQTAQRLRLRSSAAHNLSTPEADLHPPKWLAYPRPASASGYALTERTGLALAARIAQDNQFAGRLRDRLRKAMPETAEDETQLLSKAITAKLPAAKPVPSLPSKGTKETAPSLVTVDFKLGELRLSGARVTRKLADKIRKLLTQ